MSTDMMDLARRAVACKHWRWMPGMTTTTGIRISNLSVWDTDLPDLTDPATLGCLLALVREAWRSPLIHPRAEGCEWRMWKTEPYAYAYDTEDEAIVAALEAAP